MAERLANERLAAVVEEYDAEAGAITDDDIFTARSRSAPQATRHVRVLDAGILVALDRVTEMPGI